jgi:terminase small subunit-like protein
MPSLENVKHEKFCLALFKPKTSATQAYKDAGYKVTNDNAAAACASRLLTNAKVSVRMEELKAEQAKAASLTREEILDKILEAHDLAMARGQTAGALRALEILGQELHGMFKGHTQIDLSARMRQMTDAELLAALHRNLAMLGIATMIANDPGDSEGFGEEQSTGQNEDQIVDV